MIFYSREKMPKTSEVSSASTARRRSSRTQASKAKALKATEPKALEVNDKEEFRMPAGYNPSDDSEDEYVPPLANTKSKVLHKRKADAGSESSDDEEKTPAKKSRKQSFSTPARSSKKPPAEPAAKNAKNKNVKVKSESGSGMIDSDNCYCPFPKERVKKVIFIT